MKCTSDGRFGLEAKAGEKRKPEAKEAAKKQPSAVSVCPHSTCVAAQQASCQGSSLRLERVYRPVTMICRIAGA